MKSKDSFIYRNPIFISFANYKGGIGKTTTAAAVMLNMARKGYQVLGIDMDGQGDLSASFGVEPRDELSTYHALIQPHNHWPTIYLGDKVSITPAGPDMETLLDDLRQIHFMPDIVARMKHKTEYIRGFDFVAIDCPPALNDITRAALTVSDYVIIPAVPTPMSLRALSRTYEYAQLIAEKNTKPSVLGIVDTKVDNLNLHQEAIASIEESYPGLQFTNVIPKTVEMEKMLLRGYMRDPLKRNLGMTAYEAVTDEIINRINYHKNE